MKKNLHSTKLLASLTAVTVATAAIAPVAGASFTDIKGHTYEKAILALQKDGLIAGYPNNTYKPNKKLSRSDVVLLLGRYMVSLGYEIPSDYKSVMRFSDLSPKSNETLLQYAALVKDHGVFVGSNNKLMPQNDMLREHMALVLVRAFSVIDDFDYMSHTEDEIFLHEYIDIDNASPQGQRAINVLDFYNISVSNYFYPKSATTRGQFAGFLYGMINIESPVRNNEKNTIESVHVVSADRLTVTMKDGSEHHIVLDEPLEENIATPLTLTINGIKHETTVTYVVPDLKVVDIENINGGQFVIHFNQEVDLQTTYKPTDLDKILKLTSLDYNHSVSFKKGELSADKRSFKVTIGSSNALNKRYRIAINGVHAENGKALPAYEDIVYFTEDKVAPTTTWTEIFDGTKCKVIFSEPINYTYGALQFKLANGATVTGVTYTYEQNATEILFDLKNARSSSGILPDGAEVTVTFGTVTDINGNISKPNPLKAELYKGIQDGIPPTVQSITQLGAKTFKLSFSENMAPIRSYDLSIRSSNKNYYVEEIERLEDDPSSFIVTVDDYLQGNVEIATNTNRTVSDVSGETAKFSKYHNFKYDTSAATIEKTEVIREDNQEYLYVTWNRPVIVGNKASVTLRGKYEVDGVQYSISESESARVEQVAGEENVVRVLLREALYGFDRKNGQYDVNLAFSNVFNEYNKPVNNGSVSFKRNGDHNYNTEKLQLLSVQTSRTTNAITDSNRILLNFNHNVNRALATNLENYNLQGYTIERARVYEANPKQVELIIKEGTILSQTEAYLSVWDLKAENSSEEMENYYELVFLNENVKPTLINREVSGPRELTLTFSEAISNVADNSFIVKNSSGNIVSATTANHSEDKTKVVITLATDIMRYQEFSISLKPNSWIKDLYGNSSDAFIAGPITVYAGGFIPQY
ncbi:S-layer homology domain-containing protein [Lysinibacillus sp. 54212]|uniref:S-layer homology domain-containing protein n=1 Tax=Lysinibacillus sp. 54212 TaxID=3119829 RepID=UPI002FC757B1